MEKTNNKELQRKMDEINKTNQQLISGGDSSKVPHYMNLKQQNNKLANDVMQAQ
jgi:hypothetical protein